jgi:hypothetical protein
MRPRWLFSASAFHRFFATKPVSSQNQQSRTAVKFGDRSSIWGPWPIAFSGCLRGPQLGCETGCPKHAAPSLPAQARSGTIQTAIDAGADSIEHGNDVNDEQLELMREKGIFFDLTPTFSGERLPGISKNVGPIKLLLNTLLSFYLKECFATKHLNLAGSQGREKLAAAIPPVML